MRPKSDVLAHTRMPIMNDGIGIDVLRRDFVHTTAALNNIIIAIHDGEERDRI